MMKKKILSRQVALAVTTSLMSTISAAQLGNVPQVVAKPKLHSVTMNKLSFTTAENIAFKVKFQAKQCVFNIEFRHQNGTVKSIGYFFQDPNQLEWAFSAPLSYWGIGAGNYVLAVIPHSNPSVAGSKALGCSGDTVYADLKIVDPRNNVLNNDMKATTPGKSIGGAIKADPPGAKSDPPGPDKKAAQKINVTPPPAKF
jgi:hypothetical protein